MEPECFVLVRIINVWVCLRVSQLYVLSCRIFLACQPTLEWGQVHQILIRKHNITRNIPTGLSELPLMMETQELARKLSQAEPGVLQPVYVYQWQWLHIWTISYISSKDFKAVANIKFMLYKYFLLIWFPRCPRVNIIIDVNFWWIRLMSPQIAFAFQLMWFWTVVFIVKALTRLWRYASWS